MPIIVLEGEGGGRGERACGSTKLGRTFAVHARVRQLLSAMGVPVVQAEGEAEATCAALSSSGSCDHVATSDFDALLALECALPFEVVIDDPLGHCFITPLEDDVANDDGLDVVDYERTPEQDEEYGIAALRQSEAEEAARAKAEKEKEKEGEGVGMGEGLEGID